MLWSHTTMRLVARDNTGAAGMPRGAFVCNVLFSASSLSAPLFPMTQRVTLDSTAMRSHDECAAGVRSGPNDDAIVLVLFFGSIQRSVVRELLFHKPIQWVT